MTLLRSSSVGAPSDGGPRGGSLTRGPAAESVDRGIPKKQVQLRLDVGVGCAGGRRCWSLVSVRGETQRASTGHFPHQVAGSIYAWSMHAAVFTGPARPLNIEQLEIEPPRRGEVALRMLASG